MGMRGHVCEGSGEGCVGERRAHTTCEGEGGNVTEGMEEAVGVVEGGGGGGEGEVETG